MDVGSLTKVSPVPASEEAPPIPQVKNGMLYFETQVNLDAVADYFIDNQESDSLDEFELELSSPFRSLRTEFDELIDQFRHSENDGLEIDRFVEDPVFETLLNQEGMVQIADTIYQVTRDYVYGAHVDNALNLGEGVHKRSRAYLENQVTLSSVHGSSVFETLNSLGASSTDTDWCILQKDVEKSPGLGQSTRSEAPDIDPNRPKS